jgi:hypothetical protein
MSKRKSRVTKEKRQMIATLEIAVVVALVLIFFGVFLAPKIEVVSPAKLIAVSVGAVSEGEPSPSSQIGEAARQGTGHTTGKAKERTITATVYVGYINERPVWWGERLAYAQRRHALGDGSTGLRWFDATDSTTPQFDAGRQLYAIPVQYPIRASGTRASSRAYAGDTLNMNYLFVSRAGPRKPLLPVIANLDASVFIAPDSPGR